MNSIQVDDAATAALQQPPPESEWPYSVPTASAYASSMPRITSDPSQYALTNANMFPPSTISPYLGQGSVRAPSYSDLSNSQYPGVARQTISPNYHNNLDNHLTQYDMQSSRHGYPLHINPLSTTGFHNADHSQTWTALPASSRQLFPSPTYDGDVSASYPSSTYQYSPVTGTPMPAITTDGAPGFPGLSPLSANLPSTGPNRTLPNPTGIHGSFDGSNGSTQEGDNEIAIMQHQYSKNKDAWNLNRMTTGTSQGSVSSIAHDSIGAPGPASSTASSSPDPTTTFGYIPMTQPSSIDPGISTADYVCNPITAPMSNMRDCTTSDAQSSVLVNSQIPALHPSFGQYSSQPSVGGSDTITQEAGPHNGLPAPRILHPQPRRSSSYDLLKASYDQNPQRNRKTLKSNIKN